MSYKIRNSIALGIMVFLVLGVGTYIRAFNLPKKVKTIETEIKKIDEELQDTPNLINQFNDLSATLNDTQKRWENRNKDIPPVDITSQSYAYFSRLIDLSGEVKLDMVYQGVQNFGNFGYNVYQLKGEAPFDNYYRFIWYLENDRKLYKINTVSLKGVEIAPTDKEEGGVLVTFDMQVHAYFSSVAELSSSLGERSISPNTLNDGSVHSRHLQRHPPELTVAGGDRALGPEGRHPRKGVRAGPDEHHPHPAGRG